MLRLRSMSDAVDYILTELGQPIINVELHQKQLKHAVNYAVAYFHEFHYGSGVTEDLLGFQLKAGQSSYILPDEVSDVVELNTSSQWGGALNDVFTIANTTLMQSGVLPNALGFGNPLGTFGSSRLGGQSSTGMELTQFTIMNEYFALAERMFAHEYYFDYSHLRRELKVFPSPDADKIAFIRVYKKESLENIVDHIFCKELMVAKAKELLGRVLGKYQLTLAGGGTINADTLLSEGREDLKEFREKIFENSNPPDFLVG